MLVLYIRLVALVLVGFILGRKLKASVPTRLGHLLFWVGVPISIIAFLRRADLSGGIWLAGVMAHFAIFLGALLAWLGIKLQVSLTKSTPQQPTQGSFILAAMVGNTGYLGYPIVLTTIGAQYFAWALFYDMLGTLLGAYGLGVALAVGYGGVKNHLRAYRAIAINPALWSFGFGLLFREVEIPVLAESFLQTLAWIALALSLVLIGMRLALLASWRSLQMAGIALVIKMLVVPLVVGLLLPLFGLTGDAARVILLQTAMPPAFATLTIAETFNLDRDLAVTALAVGSMVLLVTLPVWLWLF